MSTAVLFFWESLASLLFEQSKQLVCGAVTREFSCITVLTDHQFEAVCGPGFVCFEPRCIDLKYNKLRSVQSLETPALQTLMLTS